MYWSQSAFVLSCFTFDTIISEVKHLPWNIERNPYLNLTHMFSVREVYCGNYMHWICQLLICFLISVSKKVGVILTIKYWHSTKYKFLSFLWRDISVLSFQHCMSICFLYLLDGILLHNAICYDWHSVVGWHDNLGMESIHAKLKIWSFKSSDALQKGNVLYVRPVCSNSYSRYQ